MTTSSAGRLAVAEDQTTDSATSSAAIDSNNGTIPTAETNNTDPSLTPAEVDDIAASIHEATSEPVARPGSGPEADLDEDDDGPRASIGDDSYYWDPSTMAPLNARSAAAIARLRAFRPPPFPLWDRLPVSRRAAVLVLLYADRRGDLRVVLTMRAASLRNYSGHAAFPGGKADSIDETAEQIARREAWEEIGLPLDDSKLPRSFRIEHLCNLPYNLAKTELVVRPCIALLHAGEGAADASERNNGAASNSGDNEVTPDEALIPKLDAKEVAAVFSAPFHNFLLPIDEVSKDDGMPLALSQIKPKNGKNGAQQRRPKLPPGPWYEGSWIHWHEEPWRMHFFYVPVVGQRVAKPRKRVRDADDEADSKKKPTAAVVAADQAVGTPPAVITDKEDEQKDQDEPVVDEIEDSPGRYKVWGMTARIIVDAAKLAYGETPTFEHNSHFGDERIIEGLEKMGRLGEKKKAGSELTHEDLKEASKM